MTYILVVCWLVTPALVLFRDRAVVELWSRMDSAYHLFAYFMALLSIGNLAGAYRAWRSQANARSESRKFAPIVAGALRDGRIDEAIEISRRFPGSHLARVVESGLIQFANGYENMRIEAANRAMGKVYNNIAAEWRRRERFFAVSRLVTLGIGGSVVVWLTTARLLAIDSATLIFAITLYAALPAFIAEKNSSPRNAAFKIEMRNAQSELMDYFYKRRLSGQAAG